ncbi:DUF6314 family protein [Aliiroseovarius lamellibrachiae]|uniref:DUF6314 family protein n=1 Tax=Aliiroseovarius lamellibrachiae TaxID=1924933 RepID=UPI001BDFFFFC|nr:DUF6314 family protein [Aliiroseovarius lamellibrachiae]MBT2130719.1 trigger factor [Aliiroseovarius lamellibrachiae]
MTRTLTDFQGRWRMSRRIEDANAGSTGRFEGVAVFTPTPNGLIYDEAGELRLPSGPARQTGQAGLHATRRYLWQQDDDYDQGGVLVQFADGRDFHRINLGQDTSTAFHDCPPDQYEVSYTFTRWPDWRATWRVYGPKKNYMMFTDYIR